MVEAQKLTKSDHINKIWACPVESRLCTSEHYQCPAWKTQTRSSQGHSSVKLQQKDIIHTAPKSVKPIPSSDKSISDFCSWLTSLNPLRISMKILSIERPTSTAVTDSSELSVLFSPVKVGESSPKMSSILLKIDFFFVEGPSPGSRASPVHSFCFLIYNLFYLPFLPDLFNHSHHRICNIFMLHTQLFCVVIHIFHRLFEGRG